MIKTKDLIPIFDEVIKNYPVVYDIGATTPPDNLIRQRVQDHSNPDYKPNPAYDKAVSYTHLTLPTIYSV